MSYSYGLDDTNQRGLVLRVAKSCGPETLDLLSEEPPTIQELDEQIHDSLMENVFGAVFSIWCFPMWFGEVGDLVRMWRVRRIITKNGSAFLSTEDSECDHLVLVGEIRRLLSEMPKAEKKQAKAILDELKRASKSWCDLNRKIGQIEASLNSLPEEQTIRLLQTDLKNRISSEGDLTTLAALQAQLLSVEEQRKIQLASVAAQTDLIVRREECTPNLLLLRARLTLLVTTGDVAQTTNLTEAAIALHQINTHLASTQSAVEEVLRLRA